MGFSRSHNDELNSVVRGTSAADTPMSIQDDAVPMSIQDNPANVNSGRYVINRRTPGRNFLF